METGGRENAMYGIIADADPNPLLDTLIIAYSVCVVPASWSSICTHGSFSSCQYNLIISIKLCILIKNLQKNSKWACKTSYQFPYLCPLKIVYSCILIFLNITRLVWYVYYAVFFGQITPLLFYIHPLCVPLPKSALELHRFDKIMSNVKSVRVGVVCMYQFAVDKFGQLSGPKSLF